MSLNSSSIPTTIWSSNRGGSTLIMPQPETQLLLLLIAKLTARLETAERERDDAQSFARELTHLSQGRAAELWDGTERRKL